MNLYLDIETIPSQAPDARDLVRQNIKPPGTLKKAESIAAWWQTEADAAVDEAWRKQALDGGLQGEIVSIAIVDDDGREWSRCRWPGEPERDLIVQAFHIVEQWTRADAQKIVPDHPAAWPVDDHRVVAHNAQFDIGFLWRRAVVHGVDKPTWLPGPMARVGRDYSCTMAMWSGYGGRVSLDALCRALGVASPKEGGMDGSQVLDAWLAGRSNDVATYNHADAIAVREVYQRLMGWRAAA